MGKPHLRSWSTEPGQAVGAHTLSDRNPDLPPLRVVWMDDIVSEWNKKRARNEQQLQYETQASVVCPLICRPDAVQMILRVLAQAFGPHPSPCSLCLHQRSEADSDTVSGGYNQLGRT